MRSVFAQLVAAGVADAPPGFDERNGPQADESASAGFATADNRLPPARQLLEALRGREIHTPSGAPNRVLDIIGESVLVATSRSPGAQPVPIEWVQRGIDLLVRDREVAVTTDVLEHRSAFVAAVLLTLPGASLHSGSPPRVVLRDQQSDWHLAAGETIRRIDLHARYGGSRFRGAGGIVRYLGEFAVDEEQPYFRMEAPESETGLPRQVIVFRLADGKRPSVRMSQTAGSATT